MKYVAEKVQCTHLWNNNLFRLTYTNVIIIYAITFSTLCNTKVDS